MPITEDQLRSVAGGGGNVVTTAGNKLGGHRPDLSRRSDRGTQLRHRKDRAVRHVRVLRASARRRYSQH